MIYLLANRNEMGFVELHIKSEAKSQSFPGCRYVNVEDLGSLIDTLLEVQRFMKNEPDPNHRKWEVK